MVFQGPWRRPETPQEFAHRCLGVVTIARQQRQLAADAGAGEPPAGLDLEALVAWINQAGTRLCVVPPVSRRLACGPISACWRWKSTMWNTATLCWVWVLAPSAM